MSWFTKVKTPLERISGKKVPKGVWRKCDGCKEIVYNNEFERNLNVCPKCGHHHRITASNRIDMLIDEGTFVEKDQGLISTDPLKFKDSKRYKDRLVAAQKKTGKKDGIISGPGLLNGLPIEISAIDFNFMGGSMGSVVGEKLTRSIERATDNLSPLIIVSCSGGARMQEGIFSLMQMAKTSSALAELNDKKVPYISVLADPVSGGVTASFAMLGDVIIAEPGALICFAGPRVIAQTIREVLPEGFQRAEFLLDHGFIDMVVERKELKSTIAKLLGYMTTNENSDEAEPD